jgi:hypothetical protein
MISCSVSYVESLIMKIVSPIQGKMIASVKQFIDGKPIKFTTSEKGILLNLNSKPDAIDYVLEIDMK